MTKTETTAQRVFMMFDDNHPNFYVGRITRSEGEMKPELWGLEIGSILATGPNTGFQRSE
tara:strand:- start:431 stop:610 length:180 start_codon:yes stop_codon:yes gene_type:complete